MKKRTPTKASPGKATPTVVSPRVLAAVVGGAGDEKGDAGGETIKR